MFDPHHATWENPIRITRIAHHIRRIGDAKPTPLHRIIRPKSDDRFVGDNPRVWSQACQVSKDSRVAQIRWKTRARRIRLHQPLKLVLQVIAHQQISIHRIGTECCDARLAGQPLHGNRPICIAP